MADYKEILTAAANRVRETAEASGVKQVYESGLDRAKSYAKIARLSAGINRETDELKRIYVEIGKMCYEQLHDSPDAVFAPLFASVEAADARIEALRQEISGIKAEIAASVKSRTAGSETEKAE